MNTTISGVKARARLLINHLKKSSTVITLSQALEAVSATENSSDWNRYQAAIKRTRTDTQAPKEYQPHKVFACNPGYGSSGIAEVVFAHEITTGKIPVMVLLLDAPFPANTYADTSDWLTCYLSYDYKNPKAAKLERLEYTSDLKALVIRIHFQSPLNSDNTKYAQAMALQSILDSMVDWDTELLNRLGTVVLHSLDMAEPNGIDFYESKLPDFMDKIRAHGGDQRLFITTMSDTNKLQLARSRDDYKLIISEFKPGKLFSDTPMDKNYVVKLSLSNSFIYDRLFKKPSRVIEDIANYIGALSTGLYKEKLVNPTPAYEFVQHYALQLSSAGTDNLEKRKLDQGLWERRSKSMFRALIQTLEFMEDRGDFGLDVERVREFMSLDKMYALSIDTTIPDTAKIKLRTYLQHVPFFNALDAKQGNIDKDAYTQHGFLTMYFDQVIKKIYN